MRSVTRLTESRHDAASAAPGPLRRGLRRWVLGLAPWLLVGCFEHFERLETHVTYDPGSQRFTIERRVVDVGAALLGCDSPDTCAKAIDRVLDPTDTLSPSRMALSDKMIRRLRDSGAEGVEVTFEPHGSSLDVVLRYEAPAGSPAADDTQVRAEWHGRRGRGRYRLVVEADDATAPPERFHTRRRARYTSEGLTWVEQWELPFKQLDVVLSTEVGEGGAIFDEVPGLRAAMVERGWLEPEVSQPGAPVSP